MSNFRTVMCSGKFDPLHEGHIRHLQEASKLGDYLIVIVQPDEGVRATKETLNIPLWARLDIVKGILLQYRMRGDAYTGLDQDGKSTQSLIHFKPDIYAKGGDRTPDRMPPEEIQICKELGIEFRFGVGGQLNQSSKMEVIK